MEFYSSCSTESVVIFYTIMHQILLMGDGSVPVFTNEATCWNRWTWLYRLTGLGFLPWWQHMLFLLCTFYHKQLSCASFTCHDNSIPSQDVAFKLWAGLSGPFPLLPKQCPLFPKTKLLQCELIRPEGTSTLCVSSSQVREVYIVSFHKSLQIFRSDISF